MYLHGLHDSGGEWLMQEAPGWVLHTISLYDRTPPLNLSGQYPAIGRLNYGYYPHGTIPPPADYENFASDCANYVSLSVGCNYWIVANEPNHSQERPQGRTITATDYATCFNACYRKIKQVRPDSIIM